MAILHWVETQDCCSGVAATLAFVLMADSAGRCLDLTEVAVVSVS